MTREFSEMNKNPNDQLLGSMVEYLKAKVDSADWHGVADAACDLRVLEAEHDACQKKSVLNAG